jgi:hypothetical protein
MCRPTARRAARRQQKKVKVFSAARNEAAAASAVRRNTIPKFRDEPLIMPNALAGPQADLHSACCQDAGMAL